MNETHSSSHSPQRPRTEHAEPLRLMDLDADLLFHVASHCTYPMLLKWMQTCETMKTLGLDTWRGQARLLSTAAFGTNENYARVFNRYVSKRLWDDGADWLDAGVHIVYCYVTPRGPDPMQTSIAILPPRYEMGPAELINRYRFVMAHALELYRIERAKLADADARDKLLRRLSGIHSVFQAAFLLPRTSFPFKKALKRIDNSHCIPWNKSAQCRYDQGYGHFYHGTLKEGDLLPPNANPDGSWRPPPEEDDAAAQNGAPA